MHVDWKQVLHIGTAVADKFVPGVAEIEQMAEQAATAPSNTEKATISLEAAIQALNVEGHLAGKNYATPRVQAVLRRLNDDSVELLNALAEAHAAAAAPQADGAGV